MNSIGRLTSVFSVVAVGIVVLYVFFVALGGFAPNEVWEVTIGVIILAVLLTAYFLHLRRELGREGPNDARRALNAMRERRGF